MLLGGLLLVRGLLVSKTNTLFRDPLSPLECGFTSSQDSRQPVSLRFFIFAVIFVIFDVELVMVIPIVVSPLERGCSSWFFILLVNLLRAGLFIE